MDKNTTMAIFLSSLVIILGFTLQTKFFPPAQITPQDQKTLQENIHINSENNQNIDTNLAIHVVEQEDLEEKISVIETKLVRVEFTNKGGDIISYKLKDHKDNQDYVEMAQRTSENNRAFSILLGDESSALINDYFVVKEKSSTEIGFYRTFTVENEDGTSSMFTLVKEYSFLPDEYMFELKITIDGDEKFKGLNLNGSAYTVRTSAQIGPEWNQKQDRYEYRRFFHLANNKKKTTNLKAGQIKKIIDPFKWAGVAGKYFTLIALPETHIQSLVFSMHDNNSSLIPAQMYLTRKSTQESNYVDSWKFYVGPRTEKHLVKYNITMNNEFGINDAKLNQIIQSSGFLGPLEFVLKFIMEIFYKIIPNWGVSIIILTILMRLIIFPLTKKSSEATLRMQELQPQIEEIQTKYKNNQQKMNEEMAKFYQTVGYNPLSGCLPLLIQFPLLFAMYNLFNNYFDFRGAMFIPGWIPDLSQGDSIFILSRAIPILGWTDIRILPVLYVISQLIFGKVTRTPNATQQNASMKFMMYGMPLMFFFLFYNAPAGLLVYWFFSNVLTLIQQLIINKMMRKKQE